MTVYELLNQKYLDWLKRMRKHEWNDIMIRSAEQKVHPAEYMFECLEISVSDIKANGGFNGDLYNEIEAMHSEKLIASNRHRQYSGHVTKYWLTKKGFRYLNKQKGIC